MLFLFAKKHLETFWSSNQKNLKHGAWSESERFLTKKRVRDLLYSDSLLARFSKTDVGVEGEEKGGWGDEGCVCFW